MKKINKEQNKLKHKQKLEHFNYSKALDKCFNKNHSSYTEMFNIINNARSENRGLKPERGYNIHHIIPRSYFKKMKLPVYDDDENLVKLTLSEHFMVHYHAWKCSTYIRREMASAFHLMLGRSLQNLENAPALTVEQIASSLVDNEKKRDLELNNITRLNYIKSISKSDYIKIIDSQHLEFKCIQCGKIERRFYDKSAQYDLCNFCMKSRIHKGKYFSDRKYPNEGVILCACVSEEFGSFWKLIYYNLPRPANIDELECRYKQCTDLCDRVYMMKIYTGRTKEELTEYFNHKFGYKRSYFYFRNVYMQEYVIDYNNHLYYKDDCTCKEWNNLKCKYRKNEAFAIPRYQLELLYNYYRKDKDILKRLKKELDRMIEINDGKDICDYRKEMKNSKTK